MIGGYGQNVSSLYLNAFLCFFIFFIIFSLCAIPWPSHRAPYFGFLNKLSPPFIWRLYLFIFLICTVFYLANGASFFNTTDSFVFKTRLNSTPLGALISRFVRFSLPLLGLISLHNARRCSDVAKYRVLFGAFLLTGLIASSLTGFRGYFVTFYLTPLFIFLAPDYTQQIKRIFSGKVKKKLFIALFLMPLLLSFLLYLALVSTSRLYAVDLLDALNLVFERLTKEQSFGTYMAIDSSIPFNVSTLGSSLSSELCNIFSKLTLGQIFRCSSLSAHRIISGSDLSAVAIDIIGDSLVNYGFPFGPIFYGFIYGIIASKARQSFSLMLSTGTSANASSFDYSCLCIFSAYMLIGISSGAISIFIDFTVCLIITVMLCRLISYCNFLFPI